MRRSTVTRADVSTVEPILRRWDRKYGSTQDPGFSIGVVVSEENLRRSASAAGNSPVAHRRQIIVLKRNCEEDWTRVRPEVEVNKVSILRARTYILCRTAVLPEKRKRSGAFLAPDGRALSAWKNNGQKEGKKKKKKGRSLKIRI